jgi:N-methylhydantoinase B
MSHNITTQNVDAATVEVIQNYLTSAADEMQRTLIRTAYSTIIYEIVDFGISLYDRDLNLIADSPGLAMFLGANDFGIRRSLEYVGKENLDPGDILVTNYPYWSGGHPNDAILFKPVFHEGKIIGYGVVRAHWTDVGGKDPGYIHDSTDVHQEGLLFPGTKLYKKGEPDEEMMDLLRFNSRTPKVTMGDLNAQIAALNRGEQRLQELYEKYSPNVVEHCLDRILEHGEEKARERIAELPDGQWIGTNHLDNDGINLDTLVKIETEVTIDGDSFTVDFSGSDDKTDGPVNLPFGLTESASKVSLKSITTPTEPSNDGHYEPLSVIAPEDNLFHATYPSPTFTIWAAFLGVDSIYRALSKGMPERVGASSGGDIGDPMFYGRDPNTDETLVDTTQAAVGWGASDGRDGANSTLHISQSRVRNVPIEVLENRLPVRIEHAELREDSGGVGEYRGGLGSRRDYRLLKPFNALINVKKTRTEGWGLEGGSPGKKNVGVLLPYDGDTEAMTERITVLADNDSLYDDTEHRKMVGMFRGPFETDDVISYRAGGGGGYGDPFDRSPEKVRDDVLDGYVSREDAREEYGVVITDDDEIDRDRTEELRS